jgi:hypothetical protein
VGNNYVVLRASPDWRRYDLEDSRAFCRNKGVPEDLILRFAGEWRQTLGMDFREFRHEMAQIALASVEASSHCQLLTSLDMPRIPADDDFFVFMDDDDWIAPHLFEALRAHGMQHDFLWSSVFLGKFVVDLPGIPVGSPALKKRPLENTVYTNNYSLTGKTLKLVGTEGIFEHFDAQAKLDSGEFRPQKTPSYLSCANKHPCCTVSAVYNLPHLSGTMRAMVTAYAEALREIELDADTLWMEPYLRRLEIVVERCLN